jgi:integrase
LFPANSLSAWTRDPKETFQAWLAEYRVTGPRQFRESSRETYTSMFAWWLSSLAAKGLGLLEATPQDATEFFAASEFEPLTRRRYLLLLNKVYIHLRSKKVGWEGENPLIVELKKERVLEIALPPGLVEDSLAQVITALTDIPGWKGARDRCAAALLIGAGLRANELINLRTDCVSDTFQIHVKPDTVHREHTTVILPDGPWREWFQAWPAVRQALAIPGDLLCPATRKGTPYSPSGLFRRVSAWLAPLGDSLPQNGPNLLRNTFARQALTCGRYSPSEVQKFLGHEELRATAKHIAAIELLSTSAE